MNFYTDAVVLLRALHWYEDRLMNTLADVRDEDEYLQLQDVRRRLNQMLKELAYVE